VSSKTPRKPPTVEQLRARGDSIPTKPETLPPPPPDPSRHSPDVFDIQGGKPIPFPKTHAFPVRVALVCPHCSSYMQRIGSGDLMTCKSEGCKFFLKRFRLPVLMAEEVE
jgi:hypothetical protein